MQRSAVRQQLARFSICNNSYLADGRHVQGNVLQQLRGLLHRRLQRRRVRLQRSGKRVRGGPPAALLWQQRHQLFRCKQLPGTGGGMIHSLGRWQHYRRKFGLWRQGDG